MRSLVMQLLAIPLATGWSTRKVHAALEKNATVAMTELNGGRRFDSVEIAESLTNDAPMSS